MWLQCMDARSQSISIRSWLLSMKGFSWRWTKWRKSIQVRRKGKKKIIIHEIWHELITSCEWVEFCLILLSTEYALAKYLNILMNLRLHLLEKSNLNLFNEKILTWKLKLRTLSNCFNMYQNLIRHLNKKNKKFLGFTDLLRRPKKNWKKKEKRGFWKRKF